MSAQLTWRALDEAGEARTAANRPAFLPQTLAFLAQTFFWPCNLLHKRYNCKDSGSKKEIPDKKSEAIGKTQPRNFIKASKQATRGGSRRVRDNRILKHFIDEFSVTGVTSS